MARSYMAPASSWRPACSRALAWKYAAYASDAVPGPHVIRVDDERVLEESQGPRLVALLLPVEHGNRQVDLDIHPVRVRLGQGGEHFLGLLVFEHAHQADAAVVGRHVVGAGGVAAIAAEPDQRDDQYGTPTSFH